MDGFRWRGERKEDFCRVVVSGLGRRKNNRCDGDGHGKRRGAGGGDDNVEYGGWLP